MFSDDGVTRDRQQLVTFTKDAATTNSLWRIRPAHHSEQREYPSNDEEPPTCKFAETIQCGSLIRLTHLHSNKNLHSHAGVKTPLSNQQDVNALGRGDGTGDGGDDWYIECFTGIWKRGQPIRLKHRDTEKYLGTAKTLEYNVQNCGGNCPVMGHLASFARSTKDNYSLITAKQGIYISR